ncbi:MAG TPA: Mu transposase C-terminal domain-containing protein [Bryobacteraceae bacterium]
MTEEERHRALARFQALRPFLEENMPLARISLQQGIALRTARRWVKRYKKDGLTGLGRKVRSDKSQRRMSAVLRELIEGLALQNPRPSAAQVFRRIAEAAAEIKEPIPSYRTVCTLIRQLDPALKTLAHEGSKVYSERFDLLHRSEAERPNATWQADHTQLDIWVMDENKQPRKPWLTVVLDDYSRAVAGYLLSFNAPSALQTALALRQAIWRKAQPAWQICGIPQILYTDHGSDFTSHHMEQVAADLKIRLVFSAVGKPRGRGKIERFFSTINQMLLSGLPGYAPEGAKAKASLTLSQLCYAFEEFTLSKYNVTPHSVTGVAPLSRWRAGGFLPRMPDSLEQLDLLLFTVPRTRRVHRDGIRFMGLRYIAPTLAAYVGEDVLLRYDPRDMAEVRVFHKDRFLCRAICQEIAGVTLSLREIVRTRDKRRRQLRQTLRERQKTVESLLEARRWSAPVEAPPADMGHKPPDSAPKLKRYFNE